MEAVRPNALVSDFDGTITDKDFYLLVMEESGARDPFPDYLSGRISHFDAMARIFAHSPSDPSTLESMIARTGPDPALGECVRSLEREGWDLIVVSAGSDWYIRRILASAGVEAAAIHANPGRIEDGRGLVIEKPRLSPFFCDEAGIDKRAVVRDALSRYVRVAFAGDGPPDAPSALLVDEHLRFARRWLARDLARRRYPYRPFTRWSDIPRALTGAAC